MPFVILLAVTSMACIGAPPPAASPTPVAAADSTQSSAESHTLTVGGSTTVSGTTITFVRVRDDSRCPTGVQCMWEGDAAVEFRVAGGTAEAVLVELHTSDRFARESRAHGVTIRLERLDPHPSADQPVAPNAYVATVAVAR